MSENSKIKKLWEEQVDDALAEFFERVMSLHPEITSGSANMVVKVNVVLPSRDLRPRIHEIEMEIMEKYPDLLVDFTTTVAGE